MTDNRSKTGVEPETPMVKEPHLLDVGSVLEVAQWIAMFVLGLIGDVLYDAVKEGVRDVLDGVKRRFGKKRVRELETKVTELIGDVRGKSDLDDDEITARLNDIFSDYR